ncbi:hypothetical protein SOVF_114600 [Spinacia oleracea]|nr:hypothetical protein SOVF_114600 [Spinacia oleracea]
MGERKVLNKYYAPDFDPMLGMSIRCSSCGNYINKGTKFNSRKEDVIGETYLGIQVFRFYFKCTKCSAELVIKTDPKNSDYVVEAGATRNFEPWRNKDEEIEKEKKKRDSEEIGDAMKSLENRSLESKRDMDIQATLDELKSMRSRHATVNIDGMLEALQRTEKEKKLDLDEDFIKSIFNQQYVPRIDDDDDDEWDDDNLFEEIEKHKVKKLKLSKDARKRKPTFQPPPVRFMAKRKSPDDKVPVKVDTALSGGLHSLCQLYDSD